MEPITEFIKPELLVLIPLLNFVGMAIKNSKKTKDHYIPLILGVLGVALAALWVLGAMDVESQNIFAALFTAIVQGLLCAAGAVYANQVWRQMGQEKK